jgi:hypothetical protein
VRKVRSQQLTSPSDAAADGAEAAAAASATAAESGNGADSATPVGAFATDSAAQQLLVKGDGGMGIVQQHQEEEQEEDRDRAVVVARPSAATAVSARDRGVVGGRHWVGAASFREQLLKGDEEGSDSGGIGGGGGSGDSDLRSGGGGGGGGGGGDLLSGGDRAAAAAGADGAAVDGGAPSSSSLRQAELAAQALLAEGSRDIELSADRVAVVARRAREQRREAEAQRQRDAAAAAAAGQAADKDAGSDGPSRAATEAEEEAAAAAAAAPNGKGGAPSSGSTSSALLYELQDGAGACPKGGGPPEGVKRSGAIAVALMSGRNPAPMAERALDSLLNARGAAVAGSGGSGSGGSDSGSGAGDSSNSKYEGDDPDAERLGGVFHVFLAQDGDDEGVRALGERYARETAGAVRVLRRPGKRQQQGDEKASSQPDPTGAHFLESVLRAFFECWDYPYVLLADDDMLFARDALALLSASAWLLDSDARTLWCASLWQENGQPRTARSSRNLQRTDYHPGRAWMIARPVGLELLRALEARRAAFEEASGVGGGAGGLPAGRRGWEDALLRAEPVRKGRQCLVPEVPRAVSRDWTPPSGQEDKEGKAAAAAMPPRLDHATATMVLAKEGRDAAEVVEEQEEAERVEEEAAAARVAGGGGAGGGGAKRSSRRSGGGSGGGAVSSSVGGGGGGGSGGLIRWMDEDLSWLLSDTYRARVTRELSRAVHADLADAAVAPMRGEPKKQQQGPGAPTPPPLPPLLPPLRVRYGGTAGDFAAAAGRLGVSARAVHAAAFPPSPDGKPEFQGYEFCYAAGGPPPEFPDTADACLPFLPAGSYAGVVAARSARGRRVWLVPHAYDAVLPV